MSLQSVNIFLVVFLSTLLAPLDSLAHESQREQQLEVALRMIGHQVLLYSGDSTSRVLPIEKVANRYRIQFDTEFQFNPEDLVGVVDQVVQKAELNTDYILAVEECESGKVAYSFQMGGWQHADIVACKGRIQPKACYSPVVHTLGFRKSQPLPFRYSQGCEGRCI